MAGPCFGFYYQDLTDEEYGKIHTFIRGVSHNFYVDDKEVIKFHIKKELPFAFHRTNIKRRDSGMFIAVREESVRFSNIPLFEQEALKESLGFIPKHDFYICAMCNGEADWDRMFFLSKKIIELVGGLALVEEKDLPLEFDPLDPRWKDKTYLIRAKDLEGYFGERINDLEYVKNYEAYVPIIKYYLIDTTIIYPFSWVCK